MFNKYNITNKLFFIASLFSLLILFCSCQKPAILNSDRVVDDFLDKPTFSHTKETSKKLAAENKKNDDGEKKEQLPEKYNIQDLPFISQAPFKIWDDLHNDACEEAAVLTVVSYRQGKSGVSEQEADERIKAAVKWQEEKFGGHYDLPLAKTKEMVESLYGREVSIVEQPTVEQIKAEIVKNNPIIVPASGRALGNPNFRQPGPVYHMLVIKGYDDKKGEFITNDVGTRKGENYRYQYQKLYEAIHDMPTWQMDKAKLDADPEMIFSGQKAILIIK